MDRDKTIIKKNNPSYWVMALGEDAYMWDRFRQDGIIAIDWHNVEMGDLNRFASKEEVAKLGLGMNDTLCIWQFSKEIHPGGIIFVKKGLHQLLGVGVVVGEYYYSESDEYLDNSIDEFHEGNYRHRIAVDWKAEEHINIDFTLPRKTLTQIKENNKIESCLALFNLTIENDNSNLKKQFFWLNASPKYFILHNLPVGDEEGWTLYQNGNKRNVFEDYCNAKEGDIVLGFQTSPTKRILAICKVSKRAENPDDPDSEVVVKKLVDIPVGITKDEIQKDGISIMPIIMGQGSFYKIDEESFRRIISIIEQKNPDLLSEIDGFGDKSLYERILNLGDQQAIDYSEMKGTRYLGWSIPVGQRYTANELSNILQVGRLTKDNKRIGTWKKSHCDESWFAFPVNNDDGWLIWTGENDFKCLLKKYNGLPKKLLNSKKYILRYYDFGERVHVIRTIDDDLYEYAGVAELSVDIDEYKRKRQGEVFVVRGVIDTTQSVFDFADIDRINKGIEKLKGGEREAVYKERINHSKFKRELLGKYNSCCLCGLKNPRLLIASHIKPWSESDDYDKVDVNNGLILCPDHDKLFDNHFISFEDDGRIIISKDISIEDKMTLRLDDNMKIVVNHEMLKFIRYHRKHFYDSQS